MRLPPWTVPALAFNNSTSLPLLLLQSLKTSGVLSSLVGKGEYDDAIDRARSYFLVCAVVSNTLTFALDGSELRGLDEDAPDESLGDRLKRLSDNAVDAFRETVRGSDEESATATITPEPQTHPASDHDEGSETDDHSTPTQPAESEPDEQTSLLPDSAARVVYTAAEGVTSFGDRVYSSLPGPMQTAVDKIGPFFNPPSIGAIIGAIIGLTPGLHRLFFNGANNGGYFKAWLTTPLKNTGELFVTLQVIVVGVKLSLALRRMKQGDEVGHMPWRAVVFVVLWRFVIMPA